MSSEQSIPAANCPYCNVILIPVPKSKKKCPSCGKDIYVRTDPFNRQPLFIGQEDALTLDIIKHLQISEDEFQEAKKKTLYNQHPKDWVWGFLNEKKQNLARKGDWQSMSRITWQQARIQYTLGKSYFHLLQEAMKEQLQGESAHGVTHAQVIACKDDRTCKKCASLDGEIFTIKEALEKMPLPVKCDSDEGWCRCAYGYHVQP